MSDILPVSDILSVSSGWLIPVLLGDQHCLVPSEGHSLAKNGSSTSLKCGLKSTLFRWPAEERKAKKKTGGGGRAHLSRDRKHTQKRTAVTKEKKEAARTSPTGHQKGGSHRRPDASYDMIEVLLRYTVFWQKPFF